MQQQIEPQETTIAMQVGCRELSDEPRKDDRHAEERQRKPVSHKDERELVLTHSKPVAEFDYDGTGPDVPDNRGERENGGGKHHSRGRGQNAFGGNPAHQPEQGYDAEHHAGRQDNEKQESLRDVHVHRFSA